MKDVLLVVRDGGGTAPAEIRVARRLVAHGHRVRVVGPPTVAHLAAGLDFHVVADTEPAPLAKHLDGRLDGVDIVVADCMLFGALIAATVRDVPSAALMPTVYLADRLVGSTLAAQPHWVRVRTAINDARRGFGLPEVAAVTEQILAADRVLVLTSRAFELPEVCPPANVVYAGPQLDDSPPGQWGPKWTDRPLVVVSLSTSDQDQADLLHRLLAAVGELPVHALVTLGPAVDPAQFDPPDNTSLERFVPHSAVLPHAALVATHAGHGTVMSALRAGVPLVCIPMGRDQYDVAARVRHHGAGISVPADADVVTLTGAIRRVLAEPGYTKAARHMATAITAEDPDRVVEAIVTAVG
ncbi:glycosyltransferase [Amycolatopsis taiwanensis]|uniref:glycosyltransferase n=1 Tax=Amycolatopsis taiwanensis TaxID=342230 RepID=UPI002552DDFA|nr:glycosyltransferase [Amycolatopsis taiwanensis]